MVTTRVLIKDCDVSNYLGELIPTPPGHDYNSVELVFPNDPTLFFTGKLCFTQIACLIDRGLVVAFAHLAPVM